VVIAPFGRTENDVGTSPVLDGSVSEIAVDVTESLKDEIESVIM